MVVVMELTSVGLRKSRIMRSFLFIGLKDKTSKKPGRCRLQTVYYIPLKSWSSSKLRVITVQRTLLFIVTAVRTSNPSSSILYSCPWVHKSWRIQMNVSVFLQWNSLHMKLRHEWTLITQCPAYHSLQIKEYLNGAVFEAVKANPLHFTSML
jgi:hypothetical protein